MKHVEMLVWFGLMVSACGSDGAPMTAEDDDETEESGSMSRRDAGLRDARAAREDAAPADGAKRDGAASSDARSAADAAESTGSDGGGDPCADTDEEAGATLHAAALELLTPTAPCAGSSCHSTRGKAAGLTLMGASDLRALLVDKASCLAPELPLVDGSGGAEALSNSWLWLKLAADVDAQGKLPATAAWGAAKSCGQQGDEPHGVRMPLGNEALEEEQLARIRSWICAGAPGP